MLGCFGLQTVENMISIGLYNVNIFTSQDNQYGTEVTLGWLNKHWFDGVRSLFLSTLLCSSHGCHFTIAFRYNSIYRKEVTGLGL